jgi:hypothetical protein
MSPEEITSNGLISVKNVNFRDKTHGSIKLQSRMAYHEK